MAADFPIRTSDQLTAVLQAFRKESGMTQNDVAARMGLTQQKLSHLELNAPNVSADRLLRLLSVLGVELVLRRPAAASQTTDGVAPTRGDQCVVLLSSRRLRSSAGFCGFWSTLLSSGCINHVLIGRVVRTLRTGRGCSVLQCKPQPV